MKLAPGSEAAGGSFTLPGALYVDAMLALRRDMPDQYPASLRGFLARLRLPAKHDVEIAAMNQEYRRPTADGFPAVVAYCAYDAEAVHALLHKQNVYGGRRALAGLAGVSLMDAYWHADGMKARALQMAAGWRGPPGADGRPRRVAFSVRGEPAPAAGKFPGALVLAPAAMSPDDAEAVGALDFASLYPSLIMAFNIAQERLLPDEAAARAYLAARGAPAAAHAGLLAGAALPSGVPALTPIRFPYGDGEVRAWTAMYEFGPDGAERGIGVLPWVLAELKDRRGGIKRELKAAEAALSKARGTQPPFNPPPLGNPEGGPVSAEGGPVSAEEKSVSSEGGADPLAALELAVGQVDARSRALKVLMNTFYGELGNQLSPFFRVALAGGVTQHGRRMLRLVRQLALDRGFQVRYGDTDSLYLSPPPARLAAFRAWRAAGGAGPPPALPDDVVAWGRAAAARDPSLGWWDGAGDPAAPEAPQDAAWVLREAAARTVLVTMHDVQALQGAINAALVAATGTRRLEMAFEEVLCPFLLCGKKKYAGVNHGAGLDRRRMGFEWAGAAAFVKGMATVRREVAPALVAVVEEALRRCLALGAPPPGRVVRALVAELPARAWRLEDFVRAAEYRPQKKNVSVQGFVARMRAEGQRVPEPGERFKYVEVHRPAGLSAYGYVRKSYVYDSWEYPERAALLGLQPDVLKYLEKHVVTALARLAAYSDYAVAQAAGGPSVSVAADAEAPDAEDPEEAAGAPAEEESAGGGPLVDDAASMAAAQADLAARLRAGFGGGSPASPAAAKAAAAAADRALAAAAAAAGGAPAALGAGLAARFAREADRAAAARAAAAPTPPTWAAERARADALAAGFDEAAGARRLCARAGGPGPALRLLQRAAPPRRAALAARAARAAAALGAALVDGDDAAAMAALGAAHAAAVAAARAAAALERLEAAVRLAASGLGATPPAPEW